MSEVARNIAEHPIDPPRERQEYWKPAQRPDPLYTNACLTCGTDYPVGARYCYVCGSERSTESGESRPSRVKLTLSRALDLSELKTALGLSVGSLIAFFIGIMCVVAAGAVGFIYTATTMLDWQAVQIWRMEWLLAAVAAFGAGTLLKR